MCGDTYAKKTDRQSLEDCLRSTQSASPSEDGPPPLRPLSLHTSLQSLKREQGRAVGESLRLRLRLDVLALLHLPRPRDKSLCTRGARICTRTPRPSTRTSTGRTSAGMGRERTSEADDSRVPYSMARTHGRTCDVRPGGEIRPRQTTVLSRIRLHGNDAGIQMRWRSIRTT